MILYLIVFFLIIYVFRTFILNKSLISMMVDNVKRDFQNGNSDNRPKDFETSLLVLASVVIKADGVVNQIELNYVRNYFVNTYGKEKANRSFQKFREVINQRIPTRKTCAEIGRFMPYQARVQLIKFLFEVAKSDGNVTSSEELEIRKIASYMLISQYDYLSLRAIYFKNTNKNYNNSSSTYSTTSDYEYEILGLTESATNDQIKKAYRTLVKKYHPDRLQNVSSQDMIVAKEKFQKIQSAYESIKEKRSF